MIEHFSQQGRSETRQFARAIVADNVDPLNLGRVRVEYPMEHLSGLSLPSDWCRLLKGYASQGAGEFFLPEIGDEVVVLFDEGDRSQPFVIGSLYSGHHTPPKLKKQGSENQTKDNRLKYLKTKSGHFLCFDDDEAGGGITIEDRHGAKILIDSKLEKIEIIDSHNNRLTLSEQKVELIHHNQSQVFLSEEGVEAVDGQGQSLKLKSNSAVLESGSAKVQISPSGIKVEADKVELGPSATFSLIKGELFQTLFNSHTHPAPGGTSGPPNMPLAPNMLTKGVKIGM